MKNAEFMQFSFSPKLQADQQVSGGQKRRCKDNIKSSLKMFRIDTTE